MKYYSHKLSGELPVVCHIPHGSLTIPHQFRAPFTLSDEGLKAEAKRMADLYAEGLYRGLYRRFGGLRSRVSRIVVDVERFEDDNEEPMSKAGMGVLYTKTSFGTALRNMDNESREKHLKTIYRPYHEAFSGLVEECLNKFGQCLILDCHTFPSQPRAYEPDRKKNRPDICLGTNRLHTPASLKRIMTAGFEAEGYSVKHDIPFSGTIVPRRFYRNKNVHSIMIEVNRRLYMNERNFTKKACFDKLAKEISGTIERSCLAFLEK